MKRYLNFLAGNMLEIDKGYFLLDYFLQISDAEKNTDYCFLLHNIS